jgi:hypothetical protein
LPESRNRILCREHFSVGSGEPAVELSDAGPLVKVGLPFFNGNFVQPGRRRLSRTASRESIFDMPPCYSC